MTVSTHTPNDVRVEQVASFRAWLVWVIEQARFNRDAADPQAAATLTNVLKQYDARLSSTRPQDESVEALEWVASLSFLGASGDAAALANLLAAIQKRARAALSTSNSSVTAQEGAG